MSEQKTLLTVGGVSSRISLSESKIRRMVDSGTFPKPVSIGGNTRWRSIDLEEWEKSLCEVQVLPIMPKLKRGRPRLAV